VLREVIAEQVAEFRELPCDEPGKPEVALRLHHTGSLQGDRGLSFDLRQQDGCTVSVSAIGSVLLVPRP
jgi:hypothetical protein